VYSSFRRPLPHNHSLSLVSRRTLKTRHAALAAALRAGSRSGAARPCRSICMLQAERCTLARTPHCLPTPCGPRARLARSRPAMIEGRPAAPLRASAASRAAAQRRCASQWCGALRRRALPPLAPSLCRHSAAGGYPPWLRSAAGGRGLHRCPGARRGAAASAYAARPQLLRSRGLGRPDRPGGRGRRQQPHARLALGVAVDLQHLRAARAAWRAWDASAAARQAPDTGRSAGPAPAGRPRRQAAGGRASQVAARVCAKPIPTLLGGARACGTAFSTPEDIPTSMRHTRPLHSQLAPPSCRASARAHASARAPQHVPSKFEAPLCPLAHVFTSTLPRCPATIRRTARTRGAHETPQATQPGARRPRSSATGRSGLSPPPSQHLARPPERPTGTPWARAGGATCGVWPTTSCRAPSISSVPCSALHTRRRSSCVVNFSRPNCAPPRSPLGAGAGERPACGAGPGCRGRAARPRCCGLRHAARARAGLQRAQ
jgi:hypothetical protein